MIFLCIVAGVLLATSFVSVMLMAYAEGEAEREFIELDTERIDIEDRGF